MKKDIIDMVDSIGFPVCLMAVIILWNEITMEFDTASLSDKVMFIIAAIGMIFMWIHNRNEYLGKR